MGSETTICLHPARNNCFYVRATENLTNFIVNLLHRSSWITTMERLGATHPTYRRLFCKWTWRLSWRDLVWSCSTLLANIERMTSYPWDCPFKLTNWDASSPWTRSYSPSRALFPGISIFSTSFSNNPWTWRISLRWNLHQRSSTWSSEGAAACTDHKLSCPVPQSTGA